MKTWSVPPILVPFGLIVLIAVYATWRAFL